MVLSIFLFLLLGASLVSHFVGWIGSGLGATSMPRSGRQTLIETIVEDNDARDKVLVIDIDGIISSQLVDHTGANLVDMIRDELELAKDDSAVKAVLLKVDSPGGEVLASDEIARAIREFQDCGKPVVASMGSVAASGGYYVSSPCRWIVAHELTITGSIGVIMHTYNYRGLMDKLGLRPEVYKSGKFKDMLRGSKLPDEITPEERKMIQDLIDETLVKFKSVVRDGRRTAKQQNGTEGRGLRSDWEDFADGRILSGRQAFDIGLVDQVGTVDDAVKTARRLAKIGRANLIRYQRPFDLGNIFRLLGKSDAGAVKVDLGVDLPKLPAGRLYFLSPSLVQ